MFEKIGQAAEHAAHGVSRRQFVGSLGRGAMVVAAALGGVLALSSVAEAGKGGSGGCKRCYRRGLCCAQDARGRYRCVRCRR